MSASTQHAAAVSTPAKHFLSDDNIPDTPFGALFKESVARQELRPGEVISGEVVRIDRNFAVVNAGLKSEAFVPIDEFKNDSGVLELRVGDFVSVAIDSLENGHGDTVLSRDKAKRLAAWMSLEKAMAAGEPVTGLVTGRVKGGLALQIGGIRAFLPGSQIDTRPVGDTGVYEGKPLDVRVIKLDRKRNNVVVSRRALLEASRAVDIEKLQETLKEGAIVTGIVKNLTDYGAFVDLGGVDGLLHVTDMSWRRVRHPSDILAAGQEITVKILRYDQEKRRISLSLKQLQEDPWRAIGRRYTVGKRVFGKVTKLTDYGCFVEVEPGVEGLVHVSEMDWANKNIAPGKLVSVGDEIEVVVLELDEGRRRLGLGMKQLTPNPWQEFAASHQPGDRVTGPVRAITDFGVFIGLPEGIDGLVHLNDLSWDEPGDVAVKHYKKGDSVTAAVTVIDAPRERVSLSIKHLTSNPAEGAASTAPQTTLGAALSEKLKR